MNTPETALETLDILWQNHLRSGVSENLSSTDLEAAAKSPSLRREFRLRTWVGRFGYYLQAWAIWEHYSRILIGSLPGKEKQQRGESFLQYVNRSLLANNLQFSGHAWLLSANSLRDLLAHHGGHVNAGNRSIKLLQSSNSAFPGIATWQDGYVDVAHNHLVELYTRIEDFIEDTAKCFTP